jgi:hypothetical protein
VGLYQRNNLNLPLPQAHLETREEGEEEEEHTILIINGASEIGTLAIQFATASGVRVISTASKSDVDFVRSLGASVVVDEQDPPAELAAAFGTAPMLLSGILDTRSTEQSFAQIDALLQDIAQSPPVCAIKPPACQPRSFVPTVGEFYIHVLGNPQSVERLLANRLCFSSFPAISSTINRAPYTHIRSAIWGEFLPEALESGRLRVGRSGQAAVGAVKSNSTLRVGDSLERQRADSAVAMSCD